MYTIIYIFYGDFLKWWYPTTMGFPTKNDHFRVFWGYHHLRKHPYIYIIEVQITSQFKQLSGDKTDNPVRYHPVSKHSSQAS